MGDNELAVVEDVVADQLVHEVLSGLAEVVGLVLHLGERLGQAVRDGDVGALECTDELGLVVAGHTQRRPGLHHPHDESEHARRVGSAVDEVTNEYRLPPLGVGGTDGSLAFELKVSTRAR